MEIPLDHLCPFCGSEASKPSPAVHCSSVGCPLNRVDFTLEQWCTRSLEEALIADNDRLSDSVDLWQKKAGEYAQRLRDREVQSIQEAKIRREKWMKRRHEELKERRRLRGAS